MLRVYGRASLLDLRSDLNLMLVLQAPEWGRDLWVSGWRARYM